MGDDKATWAGDFRAALDELAEGPALTLSTGAGVVPCSHCRPVGCPSVVQGPQFHIESKFHKPAATFEFQTSKAV